ncbi:uncharacterized protein TNCV_3636761 [Trichonephila clavipes]|nr:uncharacterized protein TNCV_3636761 [Trichonephila clavipes]
MAIESLRSTGVMHVCFYGKRKVSHHRRQHKCEWRFPLLRYIGVAFLGFWTVRTVLNPISGQVFDEGHAESGVLHSARWHGGDWMVDGIREAWLLCFVWVVY